MAEDGTKVPPAPEAYGPRRLARYRRQHLSEVRGEPPLHTQGVPIVPVHEPPPEVLEIQRRFEALAGALNEDGEFVELSEDAEFETLIAADASAVQFQEEDVLNAVQRHILGESGTVADTPSLSINPAHLSGFSSTDIKRDYDEHILGPVTMGVPVVLGPASSSVSQGSVSGEGAVASPAEAAPDQTESSQAAESSGASQDEPGIGGSHVTEAGNAESSSGEKPLSRAQGESDVAEPSQSTVTPESEPADVKPVRAMDAHGLDLSGMDRKAPKSGGRIALITVVLLLLIVAVVLGIIFLI
ncbi:hypothetical protein [Rothia uropygialis]|uniref:hypothetical protein n=1 Tax=Kocuria sp. 36 TaxID=1415402 RepID=UPI00101DC3D3|nr:hypothetical protein [Kocuria sp. 36]